MRSDTILVLRGSSSSIVGESPDVLLLDDLGEMLAKLIAGEMLEEGERKLW